MNLYGVELLAASAEELDDTIAAFEAMQPYGAVPVKAGHRHCGRVESVRRRDNVLVADLLNVPDRLVRQRKVVSAETETPFTFNGRTFKRRLTAVCLSR